MEPQDQSLIEKHFSIWSERDIAKRAALIAEVYAEDVEIIDPHFVAQGRSELQLLITNLQAKFPERKFRLRQPIEGHHNIARLYWQFGTEDMPAQETGEDVFVVENGKIRRLLIFIDVR
ncbi:nuclear transport factor 2 family protein [Chitinophaga filiformis]|uniref:Nuclear transport factor 2 family protein n=1 Tax=Chitinophaga filiformis TaxID=104663 RepID=A0ABY4HWG8_CHIFI|nr:nuclear transport factor 2 family protein [Chitinophaga filiformis]UPK67343.1 nuclear transport factor 2 family protein [Chitinophaga filiformis]